MQPAPAHYLNALVMLEDLARELHARYATANLPPDEIYGAQSALLAMLRATEAHRALLEAAAVERFN